MILKEDSLSGKEKDIFKTQFILNYLG